MARRWTFSFVAALLFTLLNLPAPVNPAWADDGARETEIRLAARQSLVITVPGGIQLVTSDDARIAEGVLVSRASQPKSQVLIHGRSRGTTRLILWMGDTGQPLTVTVTAPQEQAPPSALQINVGSFRILKVVSDLQRVAVGDESVAGVMILPAEKPDERIVSLLIDGRSPGITNLLIWTGRGVDSLKVAVR